MTRNFFRILCGSMTGFGFGFMAGGLIQEAIAFLAAACALLLVLDIVDED